MKNQYKKVLLWMLFGVGMCVACPPQSAADSSGASASRAAVKKDLVGTWEMVSVSPIHDPKDAVFFPFQRFVFDADSSMKFMASSEPFTKEWLDKFLKQPREIDYRVDEKGILYMIWQNRPHQEGAICSYVMKDVPPEVLAKVPAEKRKGLPRKGNLTLSYLNSQGKIAYQKVLAKVG